MRWATCPSRCARRHRAPARHQLRPQAGQDKDLAIFSRQLATMIDAGLTLMRGLSILAEQMDNPSLQESLEQVKKDVEGGHSLSGALARDEHDTFPPFMISMARAGETGGFLDVAMRQVAETFEAEVRLHSQDQGRDDLPGGGLRDGDPDVHRHAALHRADLRRDVQRPGRQAPAAHPDPRPPLAALRSVSSDRGCSSPGRGVWWWRRHKRDEWVRNFVDPLKLKLPVFGALFQKIALTRFSRNLSTLLSLRGPDPGLARDRLGHHGLGRDQPGARDVRSR